MWPTTLATTVARSGVVMGASSEKERADDNQAVVLDRLKVYHGQSEPLVKYYRNRPTFRSINGAQSPDQVASDLAAAIAAACAHIGPVPGLGATTPSGVQP